MIIKCLVSISSKRNHSIARSDFNTLIQCFVSAKKQRNTGNIIPTLYFFQISHFMRHVELNQFTQQMIHFHSQTPDLLCWSLWLALARTLKTPLRQ